MDGNEVATKNTDGLYYDKDFEVDPKLYCIDLINTWHAESTDGHDTDALTAAMERAKQRAGSGKPSVILAHTVKGKGVSFMENNILWHYRTPQGEEYEAALKELEAQRP